MAASIGAGRTRTALWVVAAIVFLVTIIDTGSVVLTTMTTDSNAKEAARFAAQAVKDKPVTRDTALEAYNASTRGLDPQERVLTDPPGEEYDFRLNGDSSVQLTVQRVAPTLMIHRIPAVADFAVVKRTIYQESISY